MLNTAVAESLRQYADRLEAAEDFENELHQLIRDVIRDHKRIIFNGNGYGSEWVAEAERRGLSCLPTTADCIPRYVTPENVRLFERHGVFSEAEMRARSAIMAENYCKVLHIEAVTMLEMADRDILPAVSRVCGELRRRTARQGTRYEADTLKALEELLDEGYDARCALQTALESVNGGVDQASALQYRDSVLPAMRWLRAAADAMETKMPAAEWPFPTYGDMLFSVK